MTAVAERKRVVRVVELVGPAGVGKSSISRELHRHFAAMPGTIWGQPPISLLRTGIRLGPTLFRFWHAAGSLLWHESRHIVRLGTLQQSLTRNAAPPELMLFDEGPIFALTWLRGFGHPAMRSPVSDQWWRVTLHHWARRVDAVVVLDASDALLTERIRSRPEWHEVKEEPNWYVASWMGRFRGALEWVLCGLAVQGGPAVIRIRAEQDSPESLAERVAYALDGIQ
jgi:hypothetical protein